MSVYCPLSSPVASASGASIAFASNATSSLVASGNPLSAVSGHLLSPIVSGRPLFVILGFFLSPVTGGGLLFAIFGRFSSLIASGGPLSAVLGCFLSLITSDGSLSAISSGGPLFFMPPTGSRALFLTSTPSYVRCSSLPFSLLFYFFLPSSLTPFTRNLVLLTKKRLFDQAFII